MLFLLVMEVLNALIRKADSWLPLQPIGIQLPHRASFYANNLVMFISPSVQDLQITHNILALFYDSSGLGCNLANCHMVTIRSTEDKTALGTSIFPCQTMEFPNKYLGIPLSVTRLPKTALQPLLDRVVDKLPI
jgi:hypothetical protein